MSFSGIFTILFFSLSLPATIASSVYGLVFTLTYIAETYVAKLNLSYLMKILCLLPNAAFRFGFHRIKFSETHGMILANIFIPFRGEKNSFHFEEKKIHSISRRKKLTYAIIFADLYLGWRNLFSTNSMAPSLGYCFMMLILDIGLYLFLTYYISAINPGKFGAKKSPFFIINVSNHDFVNTSVNEILFYNILLQIYFRCYRFDFAIG